ncbi:MAG: hypothetical protein EBS99_15785 [Betaproteobacteria bacterium]|nr:hypothetical protein [Betaproteobacteria bacterium]
MRASHRLRHWMSVISSMPTGCSTAPSTGWRKRIASINLVSSPAIAASPNGARVPASIGKPAPDLLLQAAALDGSDIRDAIMIGDSPATDIAAANAAGCRSILLMTGVGAGTGAVKIGDLPEAQRPTWVARDAAEMSEILRTVAANGAARG